MGSVYSLPEEFDEVEVRVDDCVMEGSLSVTIFCVDEGAVGEGAGVVLVFGSGGIKTFQIPIARSDEEFCDG